MKDWTKEELQAASHAMQAMGQPGFEEFCSEIEKQQDQKSYRYYINLPHTTSDLVPQGYTRFEYWSSKPYCRDAQRQVFGIVEYPRKLSEKELTVYGLEAKES